MHRLLLFSSLFSSAFACLTNLVFYVSYSQTRHLIWHLSTLILTTAFIVQAFYSYQQWKSEAQGEKCEKKFFFLILGMIALKVYLWSQQIDGHIFWLDEYTHFYGSLKNPATIAEAQQQPLLGYLFAKLAMAIGGVNVFTVRTFALVTSLFGYIYLCLTSYALTRNIFMVLIFSIAYLCFGDFIYSSLEGRSLGMGLWGLGVALLSFVQFFQIKNRSTQIILAANTFFFLMCLGMQPLLMCLGFILLLGLFHLFFKNKFVHDTWLAMLAGLVAFSPIQAAIFRQAMPYVSEQTQYGQKIQEWIQNFKWESVQNFWVPGDAQLFFILVLSFAVTRLIFLWRKKDATLTAWLIVCVFLIVYPPIFDLTFFLKIKWHINPWYRHIFVAFYILSVVTLIFYKIPQKLSVLILSVLALSLYLQPPGYDFYLNLRQNWSGLYRHINQKELDPEWRAYVLGTCHTNSFWCHNMFIGAEFIASPAELSRIKPHEIAYYNHTAEVLPTVRQEEKKEVRLIGIIVLDSVGEKYNVPFPSNCEHFEVEQFEKFTIFRAKKKMNHSHAFKLLLQRMNSHYPKIVEFMLPREIELLYDGLNQTPEKKQVLWEEYIKQDYIRSAPESGLKARRLQLLQKASGAQVH